MYGVQGMWEEGPHCPPEPSQRWIGTSQLIPQHLEQISATSCAWICRKKEQMDHVSPGATTLRTSAKMMKFCHLALFLLVITVCDGFAEEDAPCETGFRELRYVFTVTRKVLERGRILGKVSFETCSRSSRALYSSQDTRFQVLPDGTVKVKRQITLHESSVSFVLNAWEGSGRKHSVPVLIWKE